MSDLIKRIYQSMLYAADAEFDIPGFDVLARLAIEEALKPIDAVVEAMSGD